MRKLWDCRRTFLASLAIVGLLRDMDKNPTKNHAFEIVALAGGIGIINMLDNKKKKAADADKPA